MLLAAATLALGGFPSPRLLSLPPAAALPVGLLTSTSTYFKPTTEGVANNSSLCLCLANACSLGRGGTRGRASSWWLADRWMFLVPTLGVVFLPLRSTEKEDKRSTLLDRLFAFIVSPSASSAAALHADPSSEQVKSCNLSSRRCISTYSPSSSSMLLRKEAMVIQLQRY